VYDFSILAVSSQSVHSVEHVTESFDCLLVIIIQCCLQCFDAVGWTARRASGL